MKPYYLVVSYHLHFEPVYMSSIHCEEIAISFDGLKAEFDSCLNTASLKGRCDDSYHLVGVQSMAYPRLAFDSQAGQLFDWLLHGTRTLY